MRNKDEGFNPFRAWRRDRNRSQAEGQIVGHLKPQAVLPSFRIPSPRKHEQQNSPAFAEEFLIVHGCPEEAVLELFMEGCQTEVLCELRELFN